MKRTFTLFVLVLLCASTAFAQEEETRTPHASMWLVASPTGSTQVPYKYDDEGIEYRVRWGMDTAWNDRNNIVRGSYHIGKENLSYGRVSFQPTDSVGDDLKLSNAQLRNLTNRINNMKRTGVTRILLNSDPNDPDKLAKYYYGKPKNWYNMIKATTIAAQEQGMIVESIAPMNEPDYTYNGQGTKEHFRQVCKLIREDPFFDDIRISAGNTLNPDPALEWYNYMKPYVDEGNTHQLAGTFSNYAQFFQVVRADGNQATADELHNTMEAFVAVEYGLQNGIWWGYEGVTRGRYCRATSGGQRLGYGESRGTWTAGCVYRQPDGGVDAFLGSSERQANTNTFELASQDRDVFYDGYGPVRLFNCEIPGGTGYQIGQTNAETTIRITAGDDVPDGPILNGEYFIMNAGDSSHPVRIISTASNTSSPAFIQATEQASSTRNDEIWTVEAVPARVGGDFCYHYLTNKQGNRLMDVYNSNLNIGFNSSWNTNQNGNICVYPGGKGAIEQWHFVYAGNGEYYIQSRFSGLYLGIYNGNGQVYQNYLDKEDPMQRWRLVPVGSKCELEAPAAPVGLTATPLPASILIEWEPNTEDDLASYTILRAELTDDSEQGENWTTIAHRLTETKFLDNTCATHKTYLYKIKAVDQSCNRSEDSELLTAQANGEKGLIAHYSFDKSLLDNSDNLFDAVCDASPAYLAMASTVKEGTASINLKDNHYLLLPHEVGDQREWTFATWMRWRSGSKNDRIFDFGNSPDQCMYLTPSNDDGQMAFVIKNGEEEQSVLCPEPMSRTSWHHVALTIGTTDEGMEVKIYIDAEEVASSTEITINPTDIHPGLGFIGRNQKGVGPFMSAYMDDLRFYNYALTGDEILAVMNGVPTGIETPSKVSSEVVSTEFWTLDGRRTSTPSRGLFIMKQHRADGSVTTKKVVQ